MTTYDLSNINNINITNIYKHNNDEDRKLTLNNFKLTEKKCNYNNNDFYIIKYDKSSLTPDIITSSGLFRSIIHKDSKILSFSPPKSLDDNTFTSIYKEEDCVAEEFIEGTMINLFYYNDEWIICTKNFIGAETKFFTCDYGNTEPTFYNMFMDTCKNADLDFDILPKQYCYSFVFQHPANTIVTQFDVLNLYLINIYEINNYSIVEIPTSTITNLIKSTKIKFPKKYSFVTFDELRNKYASCKTSYTCMGVSIKNIHNGVRTKFRNPNYEKVRNLRGNQPKLQYHYLELRQNGKVPEFMKYFNSTSKYLSNYKNEIHDYTNNLYNNYVSCYIKKTKPLKEYPFKYRNHMYLLHQLYIENLKPKNFSINKQYTIEYINKLHPAKLMFVLNYDKRQIKKTKHEEPQQHEEPEQHDIKDNNNVN